MKVEIVCTTDDPVDPLNHHIKIREDGYPVRIIPAWRPDKAMSVDNPATFNAYIDRLADVSGIDINNFDKLLTALMKRHDFFHKNGCRLSDHGLETFYAAEYTEKQVSDIFNRIRSGINLSPEDILIFRSAMLVHFAIMDHSKGWAQQFHIGAIRNNNSRMYSLLGPDTGYDSIGDFVIARPMSRFFSRLDAAGKLTRTIVYNLNPRDNELIASMLYNFNNGETPGKMQFGSGWWFLDQKDGIQKQLNSLSSMGLLSRFVGMLTDSRSFLSYPRHEYFRRILCNLIGEDIEKGELPDDMALAGQMIRDICYNNAKSYFRFDK
jgi:glucuronate isomerase